MDFTFLIILIVSSGLQLLISFILLIKKDQKLATLEDKLSTLQLEILPRLENINSIEKQITTLQNSLFQQLQSYYLGEQKQLENLQKQLVQIAQLNENKIEHMRETLNSQLTKLQNENAAKLEQIRVTVEEKLQSTLEKRLGESFKIVSQRLEMVYKGLGEMQNIASGVGDLKKVLMNVKTKGIWGEVQLNSILSQILTAEQYSENVQIKRNSQERVEFAIKLPGKDEEDSVIWLPIDAKFPLEVYHQLIAAEESGSKDEIAKQYKLLEGAIKKEAKNIHDKYIQPPFTTDFAIMFLPIEGLYAEALKNPGLLEVLQQQYRVILTSPTTLSAILNSLRMGFKTLAIEKRSSEVWKLLDTVKTEFVFFADILSKTKLRLDQASKAIGDAERKSNIIKKRLQDAETIPKLDKLEDS